MIIGSSKTSQQNSAKPWLTLRLINSLPLVPSITALYPSVKELYLNTKIANPILNAGLDYAEGSIMAVSTPLLKRYEKVDAFASSKLDQLEEFYEEGLSSLAKKGYVQGVRAVAYPVGFTMEMTSQARGLALELAAPTIEKAYDMANGVIDVLLPAEQEEALYDDVSGLSKLQRKSPSRRIRRRLTANALLNAPTQAFYFSKGFASEFLFQGSLYSRFVRDEVFLSAIQLFTRLDNVLHLLSGLESFLIGGPSAFLLHNLKSGKVVLRDLILDALSRVDLLEEKVHNAHLPETTRLVRHVATDLHRLVSFLGLQSEEKHMIENRTSSHTTPRRMFPGRRVHLHDFSSSSRASPFKGAQRMPTFFQGDDRLAHVEHQEVERTPTMMFGEGEVEARLNLLQQERAPTIMLGEGETGLEGKPHPFEQDRAPTIIMGDGFENTSSPSSGNVSDIDESEDYRKSGSLNLRHAGALSSRFLRASFKNPPPTPANSPVPMPAHTPNMPLVIVTDVQGVSANGSEEIGEEKLTGKHTTFHLPKVIVDKTHHNAKPISDSNPFDALNDAPDPMGSPVAEKKHGVHHTHHHAHAGQASV